MQALRRMIPFIIIILVGLLPGLATVAGSPASNPGRRAMRAESDEQHRLPVLATEPRDGAETVRPDVAIKIIFDRESRNWSRFQGAFTAGLYTVVLENVEAGSRERFYSDSPYLVFRPDGPYLTFQPPEPLQRYSTYRVIIAVKAGAASPIFSKGTNFGGGPSDSGITNAEEPFVPFTFRFRTGSALHEATTLGIQPVKMDPTVLQDGEIRAVVSDDYGLPAIGARANAVLTESGERLPGSARVSISPRVLEPEDRGVLRISVTDQEAEKVRVDLEITDERRQGPLRGTAAINFRAGPPEKLGLLADENVAGGGEGILLDGWVADRFSNGVPHVDLRLVFAGSAGGRWEEALKSDEDGRIAARVASPIPQMVMASLFLATGDGDSTPGPMAVLSRPLLFLGGMDSTKPGSGRFRIQASAPGEENPFPIVAQAPNLITGRAGFLTGGHYVKIWLDKTSLGWGRLELDGSFEIRSLKEFKTGDVLEVELSAAPFEVEPLVYAFRGDANNLTFTARLYRGRTKISYYAQSPFGSFYSTYPIVYKSWWQLTSTTINGSILAGGLPSMTGTGPVGTMLLDVPETGVYAFKMYLCCFGPYWYVTIESASE